MSKKITALAFAGFAALALSACSANKSPSEDRAEAAAKKAEEDAKQAEAQRAAKLTALAEKFGRK